MVLAAKPRFREISEGDIEAVADLLTRGFVHRPREYWMRGLQRQGTRILPAGVPRYGYLLENEGTPVGCLLLIYASKPQDGEIAMFCNVSSWYVDPEFRNYAALLASTAQKRKDVTISTSRLPPSPGRLSKPRVFSATALVFIIPSPPSP